jgi:hypothetical protein
MSLAAPSAPLAPLLDANDSQEPSCLSEADALLDPVTHFALCRCRRAARTLPPRSDYEARFGPEGGRFHDLYIQDKCDGPRGTDAPFGGLLTAAELAPAAIVDPRPNTLSSNQHVWR